MSEGSVSTCNALLEQRQMLHLTTSIEVMYKLLASAPVLAYMQEETGYVHCRVCSAKPVC